MFFPAKIILILTSLLALGTVYQSQKEEDDKATALRINEKAEDIKEFISISNLDNSNSIIVSVDSTIAERERISHLIVPTESLSKTKMMEVLLDKHFQATLKFLDTATTSIEPTCTELALTNIITTQECNLISAQELEFYSYDNGQVEYTVPKELALKVASLNESATEVEIDAETSNIVNNDNMIKSNFMEQKIYDLTFKYNKLIQSNLLEGNVDYAKALNNKLEEINPRASQENIVEYGW